MTLQGSAKHELIKTGELEVEGRFVDASNATLFARIASGSDSIPVIYKPIAGERPLWDFPDGTLANREVAAYAFSDALGVDLVPFTVLRDGPFGPGSVQEWIEVPDDLDIVEMVRSESDRFRTLALFDAMINNTDRKFGHILVDASGHVYGCDHGVCFHEDDKLRTVLWNWSGEEFLPEELAILEKATVAREAANPYLATAEVDALAQRIELLLTIKSFPVPSELWPPVPFPPY